MSYLVPPQKNIWKNEYTYIYLQRSLWLISTLLPFAAGISTKKNLTVNTNKDFSGSHLWGNSSIPFGGTLPNRGTHGNLTGHLTLSSAPITILQCRLDMICINGSFFVWFHKVQTHSQVDMCRHFTKKMLVLLGTEGSWVLQRIQQHQVRANDSNY